MRLLSGSPSMGTDNLQPEKQRKKQMHEGCSGQYMTGKEIADKVRTMGFDDMPMAAPLDINCENCTKSFIMETMVSRCPHCEMVYAVTPCHSHRADSVLPAGIRYYPK